MMDKLIDKSCGDFIEALSSSAPVPGGGGGVGLGGSMGMALCNMVANLTLGKKKYADVENEIRNLLARGLQLQNLLLAKVDEDAAVFQPLAKAYGLPKETPEQQQYKAEVLEKESKKACFVPLQAARYCIEGLGLQRRIAQIGSKLVISDVGCAGAFTLAALTSARLNVLINLNTIQDEEYIEATRTEIEELLVEGTGLAADIAQIVASRL